MPNMPNIHAYTLSDVHNLEGSTDVCLQIHMQRTSYICMHVANTESLHVESRMYMVCIRAT